MAQIRRGGPVSLGPVEHFLIKRGQAYIRGPKLIHAKYNYFQYGPTSYYKRNLLYVLPKISGDKSPLFPFSAEPVVRHLTEEMPHD